MVQGVWPTRRHDREEWKQSDTDRAQKGGTPFGWRVAPLLVKGDWSEYSTTLGLPPWSDTVAPCPFCYTDSSGMYNTVGLSALGGPHEKRTAEHYDRACSACEVKVVLNTQSQAQVRSSLEFDKRRGGRLGRTLMCDLPTLGLAKNDRVEPTETLADVGQLEMKPAPLEVCFWRRSRETSARHRNPLFGHATGLSVECVGIDWQHTLSLGTIQAFMCGLVWSLFD